MKFDKKIPIFQWILYIQCFETDKFPGILSNKYLNIGILILFIIQLIVFFTPVGRLFGLEIISVSQFAFVMLVNFASFIILELFKPLIVWLFKDK